MSAEFHPATILCFYANAQLGRYVPFSRYEVWSGRNLFEDSAGNGRSRRRIVEADAIADFEIIQRFISGTLRLGLRLWRRRRAKRLAKRLAALFDEIIERDSELAREVFKIR